MRDNAQWLRTTKNRETMQCSYEKSRIGREDAQWLWTAKNRERGAWQLSCLATFLFAHSPCFLLHASHFTHVLCCTCTIFGLLCWPKFIPCPICSSTFPCSCSSALPYSGSFPVHILAILLHRAMDVGRAKEWSGNQDGTVSGVDTWFDLHIGRAPKALILFYENN